jgi:hypothetical protein
VRCCLPAWLVCMPACLHACMAGAHGCSLGSRQHHVVRRHEQHLPVLHAGRGALRFEGALLSFAPASVTVAWVVRGCVPSVFPWVDPCPCVCVPQGAWINRSSTREKLDKPRKCKCVGRSHVPCMSHWVPVCPISPTQTLPQLPHPPPTHAPEYLQTHAVMQPLCPVVTLTHEHNPSLPTSTQSPAGYTQSHCHTQSSSLLCPVVTPPPHALTGIVWALVRGGSMAGTVAP